MSKNADPYTAWCLVAITVPENNEAHEGRREGVVIWDIGDLRSVSAFSEEVTTEQVPSDVKRGVVHRSKRRDFQRKRPQVNGVGRV